MKQQLGGDGGGTKGPMAMAGQGARVPVGCQAGREQGIPSQLQTEG